MSKSKPLPINIQLFAEKGEGGQGNTDPNPNGGTNAQSGGNGSKTYTQADVDKIVNERTERAAKAALRDFYQKQGLTQDEATQAINAFLEEKKKNSPETINAQLQSELNKAREELAHERLRTAAEHTARKLGADDASIGYVVTLADLSAVAEDGKISDEKLTAAVKKVLDDVPAFKKTAANQTGVKKIGGDGNDGDEGDGKNNDSLNAIRRAFGLKPKE